MLLVVSVFLTSALIQFYPLKQCEQSLTFKSLGKAKFIFCRAIILFWTHGGFAFRSWMAPYLARFKFDQNFSDQTRLLKNGAKVLMQSITKIYHKSDNISIAPVLNYSTATTRCVSLFWRIGTSIIISPLSLKQTQWYWTSMSYRLPLYFYLHSRCGTIGLRSMRQCFNSPQALKCRHRFWRKQGSSLTIFPAPWLCTLLFPCGLRPMTFLLSV